MLPGVLRKPKLKEKQAKSPINQPTSHNNKDQPTKKHQQNKPYKTENKQ